MVERTTVGGTAEWECVFISVIPRPERITRYQDHEVDEVEDAGVEARTANNQNCWYCAAYMDMGLKRRIRRRSECP
jgi:hypothetical protein